MIHKLVLKNENNFSQNCYIIEKNNKCVIIDSGFESDKIFDFTAKNNLQICGIVLTHGHFDHCFEAKKFQDKNVKIYIHKNDADKLCTKNNLSGDFDLEFDFFNADNLIDEGKLKIDEFEFDIIHTPGHSSGGVCIVYENNVFTGDTIFENGVGRYDFYDSSFKQLRDSIKKLKKYTNGDYNLFYGHDS